MLLSNAFLCNSLICRLQPRIDEAISPVFYDFLLIMIPSFEKKTTLNKDAFIFHFFSPSDCLQKVIMEGGTEVSGKSSARCSSSLDNISFLKDEQSGSLSVTAHENSLYLPDLISQDWVCFSLQLPELPPRVIFPSLISPSNHRLKIPSNFLAVPFLLTSVLP